MLKLQSSLKATACLAAVALAAMGCSQDEWAGQSVQKGNTTIIASFEGGGADTRTSVGQVSGGKNEVVWNKNDAFGLFYTTTQNPEAKAEEFTCPEADGSSTSAKFTGTLAPDVTTSYAVYPYQDGMKLNDNTVSMTLPETFDYTEASNGPMYADAQDIDSELHFKHLAGLLKLTVSSHIKAEAKKFVITADKGIAGACTADLSSTSPNPLLTLAGDGSKTITVNLNFGAETDASTTFYIPILVGEYTTLSAQILGEGDKTLTAAKKWENVKVERAQMLEASFGFITIDASTDNLDEAIKKELPNAEQNQPVTTDLAISGTIDTGTKSSIAIPVYKNSNVNLTLTEIPQNTATTPLELKDDANETDPAEAVNTVTVAIPQVKAEEAAPNLVITMPRTTVVLDAIDGGTTYNEVTATTASHALVIEEGVKVNKLIVKGGNVRVKGEIGSIEKEGKFTTPVYIIKETGAVLPTDIPKGFVVTDAAVYDMQMAFSEGRDYTLTTDVNIIGTYAIVPAGKTVTLDLNGHTITAANKDGDNLVINGKMTLKDTSLGTGKIVASEDYANGLYSTTLIYISGEDASFTMTGGTIEAIRPNDPVRNGQFGVGVFEGGDFTMTGGKIEAGWYAVCGNGGFQAQNSIIKIEGGKLISTADYAVFLPQAGTTTITGGKINGASGGVAVQSGTLNISDNAEILSTDEGDTGNWHDGTGGLGNAALVINAGYGKCEVNITGGTISSLKQAALIDAPTPKYNRTISISGGTFSDPSALTYLAADADVKVALNKNVELTEPIVVGPSQKVVLDLNGHRITPASGGLKKVLNTNDALIVVRRGADLTINDGDIHTSGGSIDFNEEATVSCAIKLIDADDEKEGETNSSTANLTVNGGTVKGYCYGISGNEIYHGTNVTINGGNIEGMNDGTGIYHPQDGTLTVTGGTISGSATGIEIGSGKLIVKGGTISTTAQRFEAKQNGNGATIVGVAVAVAQHTANKPLQVAISGGTLNGNGNYALYEEDLQDENVTGISMEVTGGILNGKVFSKNCTEFITGGTFTNFNPAYPINDTKSAYVASGFTVMCDGQEATAPHSGAVDKTYEVKQQ